MLTGAGGEASFIITSRKLAIDDLLLDTPLETSSGVPDGGVEGIAGLEKNTPRRV